MNILPFHSGALGDNSAPDGLMATFRRSDSGKGGFSRDLRLDHAALSKRIRTLIRATADLLAQRAFGADVEACRALGRYVVARAISPAQSRPFPFVFTNPPDSPDSNPWQAKANPAPSLPRKGRGHPLPARRQEAL